MKEEMLELIEKGMSHLPEKDALEDCFEGLYETYFYAAEAMYSILAELAKMVKDL